MRWTAPRWTRTHASSRPPSRCPSSGAWASTPTPLSEGDRTRERRLPRRALPAAFARPRVYPPPSTLSPNYARRQTNYVLLLLHLPQHIPASPISCFTLRNTSLRAPFPYALESACRRPANAAFPQAAPSPPRTAPHTRLPHTPHTATDCVMRALLQKRKAQSQQIPAPGAARRRACFLQTTAAGVSSTFNASPTTEEAGDLQVRATEMADTAAGAFLDAEATAFLSGAPDEVRDAAPSTATLRRCLSLATATVAASAASDRTSLPAAAEARRHWPRRQIHLWWRGAAGALGALHRRGPAPGLT